MKLKLTEANNVSTTIPEYKGEPKQGDIVQTIHYDLPIRNLNHLDPAKHAVIKTVLKADSFSQLIEVLDHYSDMYKAWGNNPDVIDDGFFNESALTESEDELKELVKDLPDSITYKGKEYKSFNVMNPDLSNGKTQVYYCNMNNTPSGDPQESNDYIFVSATLNPVENGFKGVKQIDFVEDLTESDIYNKIEDVQSAVWSALANSNLEEHGYKLYWGWNKGDACIEIAKINSDESDRQADIPVCYLKCVPYNSKLNESENYVINYETGDKESTDGMWIFEYYGNLKDAKGVKEAHIKAGYKSFIQYVPQEYAVWVSWEPILRESEINEAGTPNYDPYKQSQEVIDEINSKDFHLASNFNEVLDDYETNQDSDWYIDVIKAAQENIKDRKQHQESKDEEKNYKEAKRNLEKLRKAHSTNVDLIELYHNRIKDYESKHNLSEECEATQISDITTTIDYPKFKKGKKFNKSIVEGESKVYTCLDCCKDFEIEDDKWPYGENNCPYCLSGDTSPYEDEPVETKPTKRFYVKVFDPEMCEYWDFDNFDNKADAIKVQKELKRNGESAIIEDFPESSRDPELTDEVNYYNDTYNK